MSHADMNRLEQELNQLKVLYEQYFMGIEKIEPVQRRNQIRRAILDACDRPTNSTAMKFRAQNLKAKLTTFENYWNRINKQIEDGTYQRHRFKVKLHEQMAQETKGSGATGHVDLDEKPDAGAFSSVVEQYRNIQTQTGQKPVDAAKLAAMLQKQEAQLKQKFGAQRVEFRVAVENGKPKLKAKPIK